MLKNISKVLLVALFVFAACSPPEVGNDAIQAPVTEQRAKFWATTVASAEGGFITRVDPEHMGESMGQGVSKHSWRVLKYAWDEIEIGDVISFKRGDSWIIHQVVSKDKDSVRTKGTNNSRADETVFKENYRGTMIAQFYYRKELTSRESEGE